MAFFMRMLDREKFLSYYIGIRMNVILISVKIFNLY